MTPRGYARLREELGRLRAMRPELAAAIEAARSHGDLSENADYDAALDRAAFIEAKVRDIESKLSSAEVIDPSKLKSHDRVVFGLSVRISEMDSGDEKTVHLVGSDESDIDAGRVSFDSPLGRSLIGKEVGDVARLELAGGVREYEVCEIFLGLVSEEESA